MLPSSIFLFLTACLIIELTPGPNMGYLAVLSLNAGKRAGFATVAGITCGLSFIGFLAALGMAEVIAASPPLLTGIHICGVAYLFWLAWRSWHEDAELSPEIASADARYFRRGLITNILNPKAIVFYVVALPGFVDSAEHAMAQAVTMTLISVTIATLVHSGIVLLAARLQTIIVEPKQRKNMRKISALLLALVALWLAFSGN